MDLEEDKYYLIKQKTKIHTRYNLDGSVIQFVNTHEEDKELIIVKIIHTDDKDLISDMDIAEAVEVVDTWDIYSWDREFIELNESDIGAYLI